MTTISTKTAALTVMIALGSLMSHSALAGIIRTADGVPLTTKEGVPVLTDDGINCATPTLDYVMPTTDTERVVFFDFNKSTLTKAAKVQMNNLAAKVKADKNHSVTIVGYADRMGSASYNEKLALRRAKAVRDYLVARGVKAKKVEVRSLGKSAAVTKCDAPKATRAETIACLKADRRVEIEVK